MVTPRSWPESFGGAEEQCYKQAELLSERGWRVRILSSKIRRKTPAVSRRGSIVYVRLPARDYPDKGRFNIVFACVWLLRCILFLRRQQFDAIHSHQGKIHALIGCFFKATRGVPHLVKIGNSGVGFDLKGLSRRWPYGKSAVRLMVRYTDSFIAISRNIEAELKEFGVPQQRISYIPNCVAIADSGSNISREGLRAALLKKEGLDPGKKVFAVVGRLEPQKLVTLTLSAFLEAAGHDPAV